MALPQPTGPLCKIALESFLIAGWQMISAMISSTIPAHFTKSIPAKIIVASLALVVAVAELRG